MTDFDRPIPFEWTSDEVFKPVGNYWPVYCSKNLVVHKVYRLVEEHERDMNSHRHYFSAIKECWDNLPDRLVFEFESPEILRKHALIACGYFHERRLVCETREAAIRTYKFLSEPPGPTTKEIREKTYAVYSLNETILIERRPQSQSLKGMGKKRFQQSKWDVLTWCAELVGVDVNTLNKNAGAAA